MRALTKWLAVVGMVAGPAGLAFADAGGTHAIDVDSAYTATPTPDAACGGFHVVGVGTAWGDPVGATGTWADAECANLLVDPGYFVIDGTITLTTSHGELLVLNYHVVSGPPDLNFDIHPQGTFTVDGARSTGPYAGATGSGTVTAVANLVTGAATAHVQGSYTHVDGS